MTVFLEIDVNTGEGVPVCLANHDSYHACIHFVRMVEWPCLSSEDDGVVVPSDVDNGEVINHVDTGVGINYVDTGVGIN